MAALTTHTLSFLTNEGKNRVYQVDPYHTIAAPFLCRQSRRMPDPTKGQVVQEDSVSAYAVTTDANGTVLPQKEAFTVTFKRPITGDATVRTNLKAFFQELVACDEFWAMFDDSDNLA